jgi:cytochrome c553
VELDHDGEDGGNLPPPADASALAGGATYSANCASCHGATGDGTQLAPRVTDRSAHSLLEAMREGEDGMPRFPGLTATDAANIAAYLADPSAATQPETPVPPADPGTTPTWTGQIKTLLQANCTACHSGTSAAKKIRFDGYLVASQNAAKALAAMQAGTMPPGGPLPAESVQLFADWIAGGKPQ